MEFAINILPFRILHFFSTRPIYILNYHSIQDKDSDAVINNGTYRTVDQLRKDLIFFKEYFNVINIKEFIEIQKGNSIAPKNALLITSDDGLATTYEYMFPLLREFGYSATFFINPAFIDNKDLHFERKANLLIQHIQDLIDVPKAKQERLLKLLKLRVISREQLIYLIKKINYHNRQIIDDIAEILDFSVSNYLNNHKNIYLSSAQINEMIANGMSFGGHSIDHPNFKELSIQEQVEQALVSTQWVKEKFNLDYAVFAAPYNYNRLSKKFFDNTQGKIEFYFFGPSIPYFNKNKICFLLYLNLGFFLRINFLNIFCSPFVLLSLLISI